MEEVSDQGRFESEPTKIIQDLHEAAKGSESRFPNLGPGAKAGARLWLMDAAAALPKGRIELVPRPPPGAGAER